MRNAVPTLSSWHGPGYSRPSPPRRARFQWVDLSLKALFPFLLAALIAVGLKLGSFGAYLSLFSRQGCTAFLPALGAGYFLAMVLFQIMRTVLWALYRPCPLQNGPLPHLSVIVPVFNEGPMVEACLESIGSADYPRERLEIICIDDGSTDDSWEYIGLARNRRPDLIKTIRFPHNRGKKEALYQGFREARGEVVVTVDSDSLITKEALRHLVAPLLKDARIGAVAGNVKVYNRHDSLIGKMQGVRFVNLDYLRASQSVYRTVICTPGSLSAYRRAALLPHLEAWRNQTFLGAPCQHSEDRALTNFILRAGYYTCYQRTAVVYTLVPENYAGLCRMYLRWERGNVRESCVMLGYLFTRYRLKHRLMPIVEFFLSQLEYPMTLFFFGVLAASLAAYPVIFFKCLAALALISLLNQVYYLWLERDYDFIYGVIYSYYAFFLLQWIYPYAVVTVRDRRWLTR
ncbi:MAG: glycosyltransferase [Deltaproteobacteria bacterium]|nr:glycosyltransferase [Deltaproteobacteria bacterium]